MRTCSNCQKADAAYFLDAPCNCGSKYDGPPDPMQHRPDCRSLGHEVVLYPIRIEKRELWTDDLGKLHLSAYYTGRGWALKEDGGRFYRTKLLCRDCIGKEVEALARKREYERLCKAARGETSQTYAQMLAQQ